MNEQDRRILLGRITGAHGVRGDVVIEAYSADPQSIAAYGPLETEDGARRFDVTIKRVTSRGVIAGIAGVADRTDAEKLKGLSLYVDRARLPATAEGEFYRADLAGLRVEDADGRKIGSVVAVANYGAGDILELQLIDKKKTELIPFTAAYVPVVDVAGKRVVVVLPPEDESESDR